MMNVIILMQKWSLMRGHEWPLYKGHFCMSITRGPIWPLYKGHFYIGANHV